QSPMPESPDPEWHKEPNENDAPKQPWFNELVNAEKTKLTHEDMMGSVVDFTNFTKHCLKKYKTTKADLEGPTFELLKGKHKNYIELEYNFKQCYLALTDQLDWQNPEGDRILQDLSKPLPMLGSLGRLYVIVDFFFNKDLEYLRTKILEENKYATYFTKPKATRYELYEIEEVIPNLWSPSKAAYDKDAAYRISHWGPKQKLFYRAR
ncbi:hypothetical protein Tco_1349667, partial [Tanacetum coccineum]